MTTEHSELNQHEHINTKLCAQCCEMKPLGDFLRRTGRRAGGQGRRGTCRDCRRGRQSVEALPAKGAARGPHHAAAAKHAEARAVAAAAAGADAAAQPPAAAQGDAPAGSSRRKRGGRSAGEAGGAGAAVGAAGTGAAGAGAAGAKGVGATSAAGGAGVAAAAGAVGSAATAGTASATTAPGATVASSPRSAAARQLAAREASAPVAAPASEASRAAAPSDAASARKPRGRNRRPAAQPRLLAEPPKRSTHDPADASYLRTTASGFIRMRGKTDNGRRWYQEVELELAQVLVREGAAVVVNRSTIRRLYSNKEFRKLILTRDNYVCRFCGKYGDTIDHELPRAKGGHTTPANCVCACYECNQLKANRDVDEFRSTLE